ncbi:hypothetical protein PJ232_14295, partial [Escherichia coli]|nr:hypothetical protein [Escherichia coli]MDA7209415.1 hypothetical protein [Escherichia coli]
SIPDSSLRKRLGYEVLSFSLQAHSLSQECIDKLDIFFWAKHRSDIHSNKIFIYTSYPNFTTIKIINYYFIFNIVLQICIKTKCWRSWL